MASSLASMSAYRPGIAGLSALEILVVTALLLVLVLAAAFWVYARAPERRKAPGQDVSARTVGSRELQKYRKETAEFFP